MQGVPKAQRLKTAMELLKKVQMDGFGNRKPGELSGGQQQRIALARALAAKPKLLLLDEPFSALDENLREDMRRLVLQLQKEFAMTVILVTHDREEALSMSDRIALLFDGQLSQIGTPRQVYERPETKQVADYFGNCVYIPGRVENGIFTAPGISCPVAIPDGNYHIMLRPDCLEFAQEGKYPLQVVESSFRGTDSLVCLQSQDGTLWKKSCTGLVPWEIGSEVNARLNIENPVVFP